MYSFSRNLIFLEVSCYAARLWRLSFTSETITVIYAIVETSIKIGATPIYTRAYLYLISFKISSSIKLIGSLLNFEFRLRIKLDCINIHKCVYEASLHFTIAIANVAKGHRKVL